MELQYGLPHHTWETGDPSYGEHYNNHVTLTIPPGDAVQHLWSRIIRAKADRLWARLVQEGRVVATASFGVYGAPGAVFVNATAVAHYLELRWHGQRPATASHKE